MIIDLKVGEFKPEHVGKMGFYLAAVDTQVATDQDALHIRVGSEGTRSRDGSVRR